MKHFLKVLSLSVAVLLCLNSFCVFAEPVTIVSECDISDIDEPIEVSANVAEIGDTLDIKAKSSILMEVSTGKVLYEMNSDQALSPASITKIMSLLLIMEAIDRKDFSIEDVVSTSEHAAGMGGSQIWLKENESMTVDDLLKASVIASANDATVALAEKVAGSEEGFVSLMNKKAKDLGLLNTSFKNCTGLDADGHFSSAHDIAVMSKELIKYPLIKNYSTVWMESLRDGKTELVNTNKLVRFYEGTTGLKTGTTSIAGCCLAATAERNGLSLVAVVMGAENSKERFAAARKLLDFGFSNYVSKNITISDKTLKKAEVSGGTEKSVTPNRPENISLILKKNETADAKVNVNLYKLKAPVKKGEKIGVLEISVGDDTFYTADLTAKTEVKKKTVLTCFKDVLKGLLTL